MTFQQIKENFEKYKLENDVRRIVNLRELFFTKNNRYSLKEAVAIIKAMKKNFLVI